MRILRPKEIESVLKQTGPKKYKYFMNFICDVGVVWGLYKDGWALAGDNAGQEIFPLWPAKEFAEILAKDNWKGHEPQEISLKELVEELIPNLKSDKLLCGIFYTTNDKGIVIAPDKLAADIESELSRYGHQ